MLMKVLLQIRQVSLQINYKLRGKYIFVTRKSDLSGFITPLQLIVDL